jgi:cytochrome d ubiquinol oxidase subunit II
LTGETEDKKLQKYFRSQALFANFVLVLLGPLVFMTAELQGLPLIYPFLKNPISMGCLILATFLLIPFWTYLRAPTGKTTVIRLIGAAIVSFIMLGWFAVQYPIAIRIFKNDVLTGMTFEQTASPTATLQALLGALVCGVMLIFPALGYLFKIFKWQTFDKKGTRI